MKLLIFCSSTSPLQSPVYLDPAQKTEVIVVSSSCQLYACTYLLLPRPTSSDIAEQPPIRRCGSSHNLQKPMFTTTLSTLLDQWYVNRYLHVFVYTFLNKRDCAACVAPNHGYLLAAVLFRRASSVYEQRRPVERSLLLARPKNALRFGYFGNSLLSNLGRKCKTRHLCCTRVAVHSRPQTASARFSTCSGAVVQLDFQTPGCSSLILFVF